MESLTRRASLKALLAVCAWGASACLPSQSKGGGLSKPGSALQPYERLAQTSSQAKAAISSPHIENVATYFAQAENWLAAMEYAYDNSPADIRLVFVNYGPMNAITYNDDAWSRLQLGDLLHVRDQASGHAATRNPFASKVSELQERHCVFLACNNSLQGHVRLAMSSGKAVAGSFEDVVAYLQSALLPSVYLVPAGIAEVTRLQQRGYPYFFVPREF